MDKKQNKTKYSGISTNRISIGNKNEWTTDICNDMDKCHIYHGKWEMLESKMLYITWFHLYNIW